MAQLAPFLSGDEHTAWFSLIHQIYFYTQIQLQLSFQTLEERDAGTGWSIWCRLSPVPGADQLEIHAVSRMIFDGLMHRLFTAVIADFINHQHRGQKV